MTIKQEAVRLFLAMTALILTAMLTAPPATDSKPVKPISGKRIAKIEKVAVNEKVTKSNKQKSSRRAL